MYSMSCSLARSTPTCSNQLKDVASNHLSLEGEGRANLVSSLIQVLSVKRRTEAQGRASAKFDIVCKCSDTTVIDLGL